VVIVIPVVVCGGYLTSNQKVLIYATHTRKVTPNFIPLLRETKYLTNNNRSKNSQRSEISLDTGCINATDI